MQLLHCMIKAGRSLGDGIFFSLRTALIKRQHITLVRYHLLFFCRPASWSHCQRLPKAKSNWSRWSTIGLLQRCVGECQQLCFTRSFRNWLSKAPFFFPSKKPQKHRSKKMKEYLSEFSHICFNVNFMFIWFWTCVLLNDKKNVYLRSQIMALQYINFLRNQNLPCAELAHKTI